MKAPYYVLLCAIAVLAGCVNKQVVKTNAPTGIQIANVCLSGKTNSDRNYYYIGITAACAEYTPSVTVGADRYLPVKKMQTSGYQYTKDGLTLALLPGNTATSAVCPADSCTNITVNKQTCICDTASAIFLSREEQAAGKIPYTGCMCTAALDRQILEAAKAAMAKKVQTKKSAKPGKTNEVNKKAR